MRARLVLCLAAALCAPALAHEKSEKAARPKEAASTAAAQPADPAMDAETMAMMKAWEAAGTPGKQHETIQSLAGTYDVKVDSWMAIDAPVMTSTGRAVNEVLYDGRYLEQRFEGTFMDQPFEGMGHMGYDNLKKQYFSTWMDSMSTMMMISTGQADASGKVLTFKGECMDPVTGKPLPTRTVLTIQGPNKFVVQGWSPDTKTGKEYKNMELTYTRAGTM